MSLWCNLRARFSSNSVGGSVLRDMTYVRFWRFGDTLRSDARTSFAEPIMMNVRKYARHFLLGGLILVAGQGCMPAVMHSPRIDPGLTTGYVASYTAGPRTTRGDMGGVAYAYGPVGVNFGYGWTSEKTEGLGVRLGLHVPVPFVVAAKADLYAQLPTRALLGLDGGVGVTSIPIAQITMPYAQLGILRGDGSGLHATYGFMIGPDPSDANPSGNGAGADVPGITYQVVNGRTTTRFFVTAAIARGRACPEGTYCGPPDDWSVASGVALEFRHRERR